MCECSRTVRTALVVAALTAMFAGVIHAQGGPCEACGPGHHWVDTCVGGQDQIAEYGAYVEIDLDLDCIEDVSLVLSPCDPPYDLWIINRSDPLDDSVNFPGLRPVDGHLDVIDTEIVQMCMTGGGITLAAATGPGGNEPSVSGAIAELDPEARQDFPADSLFDHGGKVRVDIGGGSYLHNQDPLRLETVIDCVPPADAVYVAPAVDCLPLYTDPTPGQGEHVANLIRIELWLNPGPTPVEEASWGTIKGLYRQPLGDR